jgi:hypothetical protein
MAVEALADVLEATLIFGHTRRCGYAHKCPALGDCLIRDNA